MTRLTKMDYSAMTTVGIVDRVALLKRELASADLRADGGSARLRPSSLDGRLSILHTTPYYARVVE